MFLDKRNNLSRIAAITGIRLVSVEVRPDNLWYVAVVGDLPTISIRDRNTRKHINNICPYEHQRSSIN